MTELVRTDLSEQMAYAQAIVAQPERGTSLLPQAYRGNPANVLIAMGLGQALDLTPAQSLYEIYVVNGRPSPSANLMAGLVRKAGHKLRIEGDATRCTATLVRKDDPDYPFEATWTIEQARGAGLASKDTWKQYPAAMLRARAIAEVVRMGASEAVLGMDYAKEEMEDVESDPVAAKVKTPGVAGLRAAVSPPTVREDDEPVDAEVEDEDEPTPEPSEAAMRAMFAAFRDAGFTDDARSAEGRARRLEYVGRVVGRQVESSKELNAAEVSQVIDALKADATEAGGQ